MERFGPIRKFLPLLSELFKGQRIGWEDVAKHTGLLEQQARRAWRMLVKELYLHEERIGRRKVATLAMEEPAWSPDIDGLVALEFADAAMEVFRGSHVHSRWREVADLAVRGARPQDRKSFERLRGKLIYVRGAHAELGPVREFLPELLEGLARHERVQIEYRHAGQTSFNDQVIEVWSLVLHTGCLYVLGEHQDKRGARLWRLDRIRSCRRMSGSGFVYPSKYRFDANHFFDQYIGVYISEDKQPIEVVLRFSGRIVSYVADTTWHRTEHKERLANGDLILRMRVVHDLELERWVMGFGDECRVVEPLALVETVARRVIAAAGLYVPAESHIEAEESDADRNPRRGREQE